MANLPKANKIQIIYGTFLAGDAQMERKDAQITLHKHYILSKIKLKE